MAKPRVFISSTYYDLKYIRAGLEAFISSMGYESILFENGDIPFQFDQSLEESCYKEVENADMFILIVGGRYGSLSKEENDKIREKPETFYEKLKSVTSKEYGKAVERKLPTFIFVEASVLAEFSTFKANKTNKSINYAHVDNAMVFELIEIIINQKRNNFVKGFSTIEDITDWLRDQWAGLFTDYLRKNVGNKQLTNLQQQVKSISEVAETLKRYNEVIINAVGNADSKKVITEEAAHYRNSIANRLLANDLIEFLLDERTIKNEQDPLDLLDKFERSSDIQEFMKLLGVSKEGIEKVDGIFSSAAKRDFDRAKLEFSMHASTPTRGRSRKAT